MHPGSTASQNTITLSAGQTEAVVAPSTKMADCAGLAPKIIGGPDRLC